jgi:hypothetical protein
MEREDAGAIDWDAAFDAIVAELRPSRSRRALHATGRAVAALVLLVVSWWVLALIMAAQIEGLSRPWR